ncbi:hypothetical protein TNCV_3114951 [Trichonephila clavipes]|nr:hypothetical protein TNCV_3114951 [Trichonephila clavipes]
MDGDPKLCFTSFYSCFFFCCCFSGATETLDSSQRWLFNVSETSGGFLFSMEGVLSGRKRGKGIAEDSPLAGTSGGSNYRKNAEKRMHPKFRFYHLLDTTFMLIVLGESEITLDDKTYSVRKR